MSNEKSKKILVTHNGSFHTDDIFACATLALILEKQEESFEVIRTRDPEIINSGDYVFDVGGVYDEKTNRFDHHQKGGAGRRVPSGGEGGSTIEYASFGLVWKKFGIELCGSPTSADMVDEKLVAPIDAGDNGINLVEFKTETKPYLIQSAFNSFYPDWKNLNDENLYAGFLECLNIAKKILSNEMKKAKEISEAKEKILEIYTNTTDKRIIVLDQHYPYEEITVNLPEPIFVIYPRADSFWAAKCEKENLKSFSRKKDFPASWAGLRDQELQKISGVPDAVFCHRVLFMAVAKSKEGAIKLAELALLEPSN